MGLRLGRLEHSQFAIFLFGLTVEQSFAMDYRFAIRIYFEPKIIVVFYKIIWLAPKERARAFSFLAITLLAFSCRDPLFIIMIRLRSMERVPISGGIWPHSEGFRLESRLLSFSAIKRGALPFIW
jgi:hypothetical protein